MSLTFSHELSADGPQFFMPEADVNRVAKLLIEESLAADMLGEPCRLYLSDREGIMGTVIAGQSYSDLREALTREFRGSQPGSECEISILDITGRPNLDEIIEKRKADGQSGSLLALRIFQTVGGVMLFANGYRRDGNFAMHTSGIDVALEPLGEVAPGRDATSVPTHSDDLPIESPQNHPSNRHAEKDPLSDLGEKSFLELLRERKGTELTE